MKKIGKFSMLLLLAFVSFFAAAQKPPAIIPSFQFSRLDGSLFTNNNLRENQLVFFCFFDVTCSHCQHAIGGINRQHSKFKGTSIYLISLDGKNDIEAFLKRFGPGLLAQKNVTVLRDVKNEFIYRFKPQKYPSMFLYSRQHKLLLYSDDENNIPAFLKKIKMATAG